MATVRYELNEGRELTAAERQQLEHAKTLPVVYDEDSPELDENMEAAFIAARRAKPYKGQLLTVYVSPDTAKEAERLGGDYQAIFGKLLDKAVKVYRETL